MLFATSEWSSLRKRGLRARFHLTSHRRIESLRPGIRRFVHLDLSNRHSPLIFTLLSWQVGRYLNAYCVHARLWFLLEGARRIGTNPELPLSLSREIDDCAFLCFYCVGAEKISLHAYVRARFLRTLLTLVGTRHKQYSSIGCHHWMPPDA